MQTYETTIYSCDGSIDSNGDMNAVKSLFTHDAKNMLDLLDQVKVFLLASNVSDHHLCIEIDQL